MTTIPITAAVAVVVLDPLTERMRPPDRVHAYTNVNPLMGEVVWDVDLSPEELATAQAVVAVLSSLRSLTPEQYATVRSEVQTLRALRQLGRNAFMALTAAERDRMIYDALVSQTIIDLALLRDE